MARKSRKDTVVLPVPEIDTTCRAGIYVRLSVEDKHTRTASIETQQLIIARYLEQNPEIIVVSPTIIRQSLTKNCLKRCRLCSAGFPCRPGKPGSTH